MVPVESMHGYDHPLRIVYLWHTGLDVVPRFLNAFERKTKHGLRSD